MIFLPIKPEYALAIQEGRKKVEFRKIAFKRKDVGRCIVYVSSPYKRVIGYFEFDKIDEGSPREIWEKYKEVAGVCKEDYEEYYRRSEKAFAIIINKFVLLEEPISPQEKIENFRIPQSFCYLEDRHIQAFGILEA